MTWCDCSGHYDDYDDDYDDYYNGGYYVDRDEYNEDDGYSYVSISGEVVVYKYDLEFDYYHAKSRGKLSCLLPDSCPLSPPLTFERDCLAKIA
jgi:hypothetical protein